MTRNDDFIEHLELYLDESEGMTPLPDVIRHAVRAELPKRRQVQPQRGLARFTTMNSTMRYGIAAAAVALVALVGWNVLAHDTTGLPPASPTPQPTPTPEASAQAVVMPDKLQEQHFYGPAGDLSAAGTISTTELLINPRGVSVTGNGARSWYFSIPSAVGPDSFTLRATNSSQGCHEGDEGTYTWQLSELGARLTLAAEQDACSDRAAALSGVWMHNGCKDQHSSCLGDLDAGSYMSSYFQARTTSGAWDPRMGTFTYTVPDGWSAYAEWPDGYGLTPRSEYATSDGIDCYDCAGEHDTIVVLPDFGAAANDCSDAYAAGVGTRADDLVAWLTQHPGLEVTNVSQVTIGGGPATSLSVSAASDWAGTCGQDDPVAAVPLFYKEPSTAYALPAGDAAQLFIFDAGADHTLIVMVDAAGISDPSTFLSRAMPVIDTFAFHE